MAHQAFLFRSVTSSTRPLYTCRKLSLVLQDFTEVDSNVTRHVPWELDQGDWDGMILHYLGLDHIGHKSGPKR